MNRKLLLLDVVLAAVAIWAGFQLRNEWRAAKAREAAMRNRRPAVAPAPKFNPLPPEPPVLASGYAAIAQKMLFDKSRNPDVPIELPPAPPPKPMPPLPVYHGQMDIGHGPVVFLSETNNSPHQAVHPGETIGQFKLLSVNSTEMTLEWDGKEIHKLVNELMATATPAPAQPQAAARTDAPPTPAAPPPPTPSGPGEMTQFGSKVCNVNDGQAEGAVVDGFRKVVYKTPFGQQCVYEPVK